MEWPKFSVSTYEASNKIRVMFRAHSYSAKERGNILPSIGFEKGDGLERSSHTRVILSVNSPDMKTILVSDLGRAKYISQRENTYILTRIWNESNVGMINDSYLLI